MDLTTKILIIMALVSVLFTTAYCRSFIPGPGDGPVVAIDRPDYSFRMYLNGKF